jgi:transcriptional regulator with AAA-type ATPase domain
MSSLFQGIVYYSHNNFEISVWVEAFDASDPQVLETLTAERIEPLFLQCAALQRCSNALGIDFIDFSRFRMRQGYTLQFPIILPTRHHTAAGNSTGLKELRQAFRKNRHFRELNEANAADFFDRLAEKYTFDNERFYIYRYDDLASAILKAYPVTSLKTGANLKINIKTPGPVQKRMVKLDIVNYFVSETVFFADIENKPGELPALLARHIPAATEYKPGDFIAVFEQLNLFLKQSAFTAVVLMIDRLTSEGDARFLDYLLDVSGAATIIAICFDAREGLTDFDLQLKEKPQNLAAQHLRFETGKSECEVSVEKEREGPGSGIAGSPGAAIASLLQTGQGQTLKQLLLEYLQKGTGFDIAYPGLERILRKCPGERWEDPDLVEALATVLVEGNDPVSARTLLNLCRKEKHPGLKSPALGLKAVRLFQVEKDFIRMKQGIELLEKETGGKIPGPLRDEYHYLKFVLYDRYSEKASAELHLQKIKSRLFRTRAALRSGDQRIYQGDYKRAKKILADAADFFKQNGFARDEIEARNLQAKLLRETGDFQGAEKMYKNLFIQSEMKNYRLLSAYICVDLGNLHWRKDRFHRAGTWYSRALNIFRDLDNKNGSHLARFNLVEIDKISGYWEETREYLESVLTYDNDSGSAASLAVDYFNIAHLEFLKHNNPRAREFVENALFLFKKGDHYTQIAECERLKLQLALTGGEESFDLSGLKTCMERIEPNRDQKALLSVMETAASDPDLRKSAVIAQKAALIQSKTLCFELMTSLIHRYKTTEFLEQLKSLSMALSSEVKNYFYYEYYYIYYCYFQETNRGSTFQQEEKERFNDVYYFFLRNRRRLAPAVIKMKHRLDEQDAAYDVFKSAQLVSDFRHWKIPEDFFNSLTAELKQLIPADLVRLRVYEQERSEPLFDFSSVPPGSPGFLQLTQEMIDDALSRADHLNLDPREIKRRYRAKEKAFYVYADTKVVLWKISDSLFSILLLGISSTEFYDYDFYGRHNDFLIKFASLIRRYYETGYQLNRKLSFIIGQSPPVEHLKELILKTSKVDFSLLIRGESGSGKELVAKAVHLLSRRSTKPFVPVNAAAIPENLLEAELFGYKKGAFTGANENKTGLIESAHRGTLFLDEIADLPITLQAKLLRVLQEHEIRRLGENKTIRIDIRLVSATNKDLKRLIAQHRFREDLYFRIQDLTIDVPPLRERTEDIPLLVRHFLEKYGFSIDDENELQRVCDYFRDRTWTGNVRELESSVKRLITYYPDFDGDPESTGTPAEETGLIQARDKLEKEMVSRALEEYDWNKNDTAAALKITRQFLFRLIQKYRLTKD